MTARRLAAVLLAAALSSPVAWAAPATGGPVVVPADGSTVASPLPTLAGHRYRVTVTGAYSYNGRQNLADCGWWNPETAGDAWFPAGYLAVNGVTAACASQPYTTTHTYTWEQDGTGAPFTFRVTDAGGTADNAGALVADVVEVAEPAAVHGECARLTVSEPNTGHTAVHVVVSAVATGGAGVPLAYAICTFRDASGQVVATVQTRTVGPRAYGTDVILLPAGAYTSCYAASAVWLLDSATAVDSGC